jgi:hypothetical protein
MVLQFLLDDCDVLIGQAGAVGDLTVVLIGCDPVLQHSWAVSSAGAARYSKSNSEAAWVAFSGVSATTTARCCPTCWTVKSDSGGRRSIGKLSVNAGESTPSGGQFSGVKTCRTPGAADARSAQVRNASALTCPCATSDCTSTAYTRSATATSAV